MPDPTVGPNVTINLRNPVAKSENKKSIRYHILETPHLLQSGTQLQNSQHRRDPHGEEDRKVCLFDLQCHQLTEIMGHHDRDP